MSDAKTQLYRNIITAGFDIPRQPIGIISRHCGRDASDYTKGMCRKQRYLLGSCRRQAKGRRSHFCDDDFGDIPGHLSFGGRTARMMSLSDLLNRSAYSSCVRIMKF
nr:MAG TPA: hypothetical protein [Caudoviricetes sp.]